MTSKQLGTLVHVSFVLVTIVLCISQQLRIWYSQFFTEGSLETIVYRWHLSWWHLSCAHMAKQTRKELSCNVKKDYFAHPLKLPSIHLFKPVHFIIFCFYFDVKSDSYAKNYKFNDWIFWFYSHFIGHKHDKSKTWWPLMITMFRWFSFFSKKC